MCFRAEGEKTGVIFEDDPQKVLAAGVTDNYLRVGLPNGEYLVHLIKPGQPFNLQFGRLVSIFSFRFVDRQSVSPFLTFCAHPRHNSARFELTFGIFRRATLATLLGIQDRTDWKQCTKSDAEEKADTLRFKQAFKQFEP